MTLSAGTRLVLYEILEPLGAGELHTPHSGHRDCLNLAVDRLKRPVGVSQAPVATTPASPAADMSPEVPQGRATPRPNPDPPPAASVPTPNPDWVIVPPQPPVSEPASFPSRAEPGPPPRKRSRRPTPQNFNGTL
jgi:hypothetical protein